VQARWASGRCLLSLRKGKQLPKGIREFLQKELRVSGSEVSARMKFADKFDTEEKLSNALETYGSWHNIIRDALTTKPRSDESKKSAFQRILDFANDYDTTKLTDADLALFPAIRAALDRLESGAQTLDIIPTKRKVKRTFSAAGDLAHLLRGGGSYPDDVRDEHLRLTLEEVCETESITLALTDPMSLSRFEGLFLQHFEEIRTQGGSELIDQRQCADDAAKLAVRELASCAYTAQAA
jgi:hypothetical protein